MTTTKRNELIARYAANVAHYERTNNETMRRQNYLDGLEVACIGRSVKAGERALEKAIAAAK